MKPNLVALNLKKFLQEKNSVCKNCGRNPDSVQLVAVSKKQPLEKIKEAYQEEQIDFGENYIQEALEKQEELQTLKIRWHLIGPIQKNKINKIIGKFSLIHSVDSYERAVEINKRAEMKNLNVDVLLQLNLANEDTKSGQTKEEVLKNWPSYQTLKFIRILGLMTMPPLQENPEESRKYFQELKKIATKLKLKHLSMGTSSDWKVAVEEGATLIRIGTSIFGERDK
jgi:PLP dependent protein